MWVRDLFIFTIGMQGSSGIVTLESGRRVMATKNVEPSSMGSVPLFHLPKELLQMVNNLYDYMLDE